LLDSGCKRSVTARSLVPNVKLTCLHYNLSVANKTKLPIVGDTDLQFTVNGHRFVDNVSASLVIDEFLLGIGCLVETRPKGTLLQVTLAWVTG